MNTKTCLIALIAVVATLTNVQGQKLCKPSCIAETSNKNIVQLHELHLAVHLGGLISSCCRENEQKYGANFNACCASSCATNSPCDVYGSDPASSS